MKEQNFKSVAKNIEKSKLARCVAAIILTVLAVLSVPAFAFMDVNPVNWDLPARGFSMAMAAALSLLVALAFTGK